MLVKGVRKFLVSGAEQALSGRIVNSQEFRKIDNKTSFKERKTRPIAQSRVQRDR